LSVRESGDKVTDRPECRRQTIVEGVVDPLEDIMEPKHALSGIMLVSTGHVFDRLDSKAYVENHIAGGRVRVGILLRTRAACRRDNTLCILQDFAVR